MPRELNPEVEVPFGIVSTFYPGASAKDIESTITNIIENKVENIDHLKEITSRSKNSISVVVLEFESGIDIDKSIADLKDLIDEVKPDLPSDLPNDPQITQASVSTIPIMTLSLGGDFALSELKAFADIIEDETKSIDGIKDVPVSGITQEQFHIYVDPYKITTHELSVDQIANAIRQANLDIPFGSIEVDGESVEVRGVGKVRTVDDIQNIPLISNNGTVLLGEIATIRKEFNTQEVETYAGSPKGSLPSISIDFVKTEKKVNINKIATSIFTTLDDLRAKNRLPQNLNIDVVFNSADEVQKSLDTLTNSGLQTVIIIAILLWIFLGWRESLLALIAIPLSMLFAIFTLSVLGKTFNFLSLFALILSLGLLVDNAIIMVEAISDNIRIKNMPPVKAAVKAIKSFRWPVIAGTLTTIFAFLPMIFMISGVSGDFISIIPITVTIMLSVSLFVSIFLLPALGVIFFQTIPPKENSTPQIIKKVQIWYREVIIKILSQKKYITLVIIGSILSLASVVIILMIGFVKVEIFPEDDVEVFTVELELPKGTAIEESRVQIHIIDQVLTPYLQAEGTEKWLKSYTIFVGQKSPYDPSVSRGGSNDPSENIIGITMTLKNKKERNLSSTEASKLVQKQLRALLPSHISVTTKQKAAGPGGGDAPIAITVSSDHLEELEDIAQKMEKALQNIELPNGSKLKNVNNDFGERNTQIVWKFDREKMIQYGLSITQLQTTLRAALEGIQIFDITENNESVEVWMRLNFSDQIRWKSPKSLEVLNEIPIRTPRGSYISLSELANFHYEESLPVIRHIDGKRTVKITADIDGRATPKEFDQVITQAFKKINTNPHNIFKIGGDSEESDTLVKEMGRAMGVAIFLILLVLVIQFNSFSQPLVMIFLIPLSLVTVFWGFGIGGQFSDLAIGFPTMIGIVALAGIMINDAIVFVDRYNQHRETHKMTRPEALSKAGMERFQPIFLTSITTVFGLLPLALSDPIWAGLGFAIIFGMATSTITTLFILPCLLISIQRGNEWFHQFLVGLFKK